MIRLVADIRGPEFFAPKMPVGSGSAGLGPLVYGVYDLTNLATLRH